MTKGKTITLVVAVTVAILMFRIPFIMEDIHKEAPVKAVEVKPEIPKDEVVEIARYCINSTLVIHYYLKRFENGKLDFVRGAHGAAIEFTYVSPAPLPSCVN
jgi:hypothetical protein